MLLYVKVVFHPTLRLFRNPIVKQVESANALGLAPIDSPAEDRELNGEKDEDILQRHLYVHMEKLRGQRERSASPPPPARYEKKRPP